MATISLVRSDGTPATPIEGGGNFINPTPGPKKGAISKVAEEKVKDGEGMNLVITCIPEDEPEASCRLWFPVPGTGGKNDDFAIDKLAGLAKAIGVSEEEIASGYEFDTDNLVGATIHWNGNLVTKLVKGVEKEVYNADLLFVESYEALLSGEEPAKAAPAKAAAKAPAQVAAKAAPAATGAAKFGGFGAKPGAKPGGPFARG